MGSCMGKKSTVKSSTYKYRTKFIENNTILKSDIEKYYKLGKIIGNGKQGAVRTAKKISIYNKDYSSNKEVETNSVQKFAVKCIHKLKLAKNSNAVQRELEVLAQLDHPNILKLHEIYEDDLCYYIVQDYCTGGQLAEKMMHQKNLTEKQAAAIMKKLFSACSLMQSKSIVHGNLTPENIYLSKEGEIKIIDFAMSQKLNDNDLVITVDMDKSIKQFGVTPYLAPEIVCQTPSVYSDNWSLGIVLYQLLSGQLLFYDDDNQKMIHNIRYEAVPFKEAVWKTIAPQAKNLIMRLLEKNPNKRITSAQALKDPWITTHCDENLFLFNDKLEKKAVVYESISEKQINLMRTYATCDKLKKEIMKAFVRNLPERHILGLQSMFNEVDLDQNGIVSLEEMLYLMKTLGLNDTRAQITKLIQGIHLTNTINSKAQTYLSFSEFVGAILNPQIYLNKETLWDVFKYFDVQNKHYLKLSDLEFAFQRQGRELTKEMIQALFEELDIDRDGKADFADFCRVMLPKMREKEFQRYYKENYEGPDKPLIHDFN